MLGSPFSVVSLDIHFVDPRSSQVQLSELIPSCCCIDMCCYFLFEYLGLFQFLLCRVEKERLLKLKMTRK